MVLSLCIIRVSIDTRGHVTSTTRSLNLMTGDGESGVSALSLVGLMCSIAYGSVTHQCKSYTIKAYI